ncbi:uncharacterized protein LOC132200462 isoform X2 [Neocloeon triangulifer]|uniref:uncharacterized protein LOC132200462 isoform X2 n=1 Tax=Neocloeon triangulifer TaxID=2078957 RepID=UPI00286F4D78|nr:uncharacterized protein LOC132200462 isoform X2 [Neocloeon triangulifer]
MKMSSQLLMFVAIILANRCLGLRDVRVIVPTAVMSGHGAKLICVFDLQGESLYAIKWYRGQREIYRFMPRESPSQTSFPISGIEIDISKSDANNLKIKSIHADLSGNFTCEVTADDSFSSVSVTQAILVVEMPDRAPIITVEKKRSENSGQIITANCTNIHSRPPGKLNLFINEEPVDETDLERFMVPDGKSQLEVASLTKIITEEQLEDMSFSLRLKCVSSVFTFKRMTEVLLIEQRLRSESILAPTESSSPSNFTRDS